MEVKLENCFTTRAHDEHSAAAPGEPRLFLRSASCCILCLKGADKDSRFASSSSSGALACDTRHMSGRKTTCAGEACMSTPGQHASHTAMLLWLRRSDAMPPAQQTRFPSEKFARGHATCFLLSCHSIAVHINLGGCCGSFASFSLLALGPL